MAAPRTRPQSDRIVYMPTAASTAYAPGDLLYEEGGIVYPASSQADQLAEIANQRLFAKKFFGISNGQKLASNSGSDAIPVIVGVDYEFAVASGNYTVGQLLAADEAASGTALLNGTPVVTTDPSAAIAEVVENRASTTRVFARLLNTFSQPSQPQSLLTMIGQTIDMNDAPVTLTKVPGTPTGTFLYGNILYVDPNGNNENMLLPNEADMINEVLIIKNTGGEHIALQTDAGAAVATIEDNETCIVHNDAGTWKVMQHVFTT